MKPSEHLREIKKQALMRGSADNPWVDNQIQEVIFAHLDLMEEQLEIHRDVFKKIGDTFEELYSKVKKLEKNSK